MDTISTQSAERWRSLTFVLSADFCYLLIFCFLPIFVTCWFLIITCSICYLMIFVTCWFFAQWSLINKDDQLQVTDLRLSRSAGRGERPSTAQHRQSHLWEQPLLNPICESCLFSIPSVRTISPQSHLNRGLSSITNRRGHLSAASCGIMPLVKCLETRGKNKFYSPNRDKTTMWKEASPEKESEPDIKIAETSTTSFFTLNPRSQNRVESNGRGSFHVWIFVSWH